MPTFENLPLIITSLVLLVLIYFYATRKLNINLRKNFSQVFEQFKSRISFTIFGFVALVIASNYVAIEPLPTTSEIWFERALTIGLLLFMYLLVALFLDILEAAYQQSKLSLRRPLRPLIQALKIVFMIVIFFGVIAIILERDPLLVMGSVSTIVAFLSFIFKDLLLGLFGGIQLTTTDTIRIGDYISVPELNISGSVKSIDLVTITLVPKDQTHITVGAYNLLQNPIINYRHLSKTEGRQYVKRFNFNSKNNINFTNFESELRNLLVNHPNINQEKLISIQFEEGDIDNLVLIVNAFSRFPDFESFDAFSTKLSIEILNIMAKYELFK